MAFADSSVVFGMKELSLNRDSLLVAVDDEDCSEEDVLPTEPEPHTHCGFVLSENEAEMQMACTGCFETFVIAKLFRCLRCDRSRRPDRQWCDDCKSEYLAEFARTLELAAEGKMPLKEVETFVPVEIGGFSKERKAKEFKLIRKEPAHYAAATRINRMGTAEFEAYLAKPFVVCEQCNLKSYIKPNTMMWQKATDNLMEHGYKWKLKAMSCPDCRHAATEEDRKSGDWFFRMLEA